MRSLKNWSRSKRLAWFMVTAGVLLWVIIALQELTPATKTSEYSYPRLAQAQLPAVSPPPAPFPPRRLTPISLAATGPIG